MTPLEEQTMFHINSLFTSASDAQTHLEEYAKELYATNPALAGKMVTMALMCRELVSMIGPIK